MKAAFSREGVAEIKKIIIILAVALLGSFVARLIVHSNPYFWLMLAAFPVLVFIIKNERTGLIIVMFSVFFADWFFEVGLIPTQLTWLPEITLLIYITKILITKKGLKRTPIDLPIILFIAVFIFSMLMNSKSPISGILALRLDFKFILMFYVLISFDFSEEFFRKMIKIIVFLLAIQVPVAIIKFFRFGQNEAAIGTYASFGGELSTILPLFAISLFLGFYLIYKNQKFRGRFIIYNIGYLIFPVLAGKKGFFFFGFFLLGFLARQAGKEILGKLIPVGVILLPGLLASLYFVPGLRPALKNPGYLWKYSISYETVRSEKGEAGGRLVAIGDTFNAAKKDAVHFLVGWGPGSTIQSFFGSYNAVAAGKLPVKIYYGFTHLVSTVIEYGYLGFLFYFIMPLYILFKANRRFYKKISDPFWKATSFGFGGILFSVFSVGLLYKDLLRQDVVGFLFWFFAAAIVVIAKKYQTSS
jgi:hypothetical protein